MFVANALSAAASRWGTRARRILGAVAKEPLLHFLVLGAALFCLHAWVESRRGEISAPDEIVVTQVRIQSLADGFTRTWQRPPTDEEMAGLVRDHLREEVLSRQAIALGLDRDDTIVRRRLAQKMEFLAEGIDEIAEPTDAELADYLERHAESFRTEERFTFRQVFLDPQRRGSALAADAARFVAELNATGVSADTGTLGDSRMLDERMEDAAPREIAAQFGEGFAAALRDLPLGRWQGPVASGYGAHVVLVASRVPGSVPELAEVRDAVSRAWSAAKRGEMKKARIDELLSAYRITIEPVQPITTSGGAGVTR